jgi:hypothetical protein
MFHNCRVYKSNVVVGDKAAAEKSRCWDFTAAFVYLVFYRKMTWNSPSVMVFFTVSVSLSKAINWKVPLAWVLSISSIVTDPSLGPQLVEKALLALSM